MGFKAWETPRDFFDKVNDYFRFTLDAAASHENALLPRYCTETGKWEVESDVPCPFNRFGLHAKDCNHGHASLTMLSHKTGLDPESWAGERVFCNPPYDNTLYQWVKIAASRVAEISVLLLPPSIDTKWFHEFIWYDGGIETATNHLLIPQPRKDVEVHFLNRRLKFWRDGKPGPSPRNGNMMVVFK